MGFSQRKGFDFHEIFFLLLLSDMIQFGEYYQLRDRGHTQQDEDLTV